MSNEEDFKIEVTNHLRDPDPHSVSIENSEEFQEYLDMLEAAAENGESLANLIAMSVMTLFSPGFVLIGSPVMESSEDGIMMPEEVGVCLSTRNDMTPTGLAALLRRLANAIDEDIDTAIDTLKDTNDNN